MLAKAVQAAGGSVHVSAQEILRLDAGYMLDVQPDGKGGVTLTFKERTDTVGLDEIWLRSIQDEGR